MKKRQHVPKTKENIIFFPGMVEKLISGWVSICGSK